MHILGEIVISTALLAAAPISGAEWDGASARVSASVVSHVLAVAHVLLRRTHHGGMAITIGIAHGVAGRTSSDSWEGASEAGRAALEVGESARRAVPVTGAGAVLAGRKAHEDIGSFVENSVGRRRNFNSLIIESTAIHAKAFSSLQKSAQKLDNSMGTNVPLRGMRR
jgi:hypothetical protein